MLSNSTKYSSKGVIKVKAFIIQSGENIHLMVQVQDEGVGINTEDLKNLFTPFALSGRVNTKKSVIGNGFGLSVCK